MQNEHISEAAFEEILLSDRADATARELSEQVFAHCRECASCGSMLNSYLESNREIESLKEAGINGVHDPCPSEELWLQLAAGMLSDKHAAKLLKHACDCWACAQYLSRIQSYLEDEPLHVPALNSATSAWQHGMARQMALHAQSMKKPRSWKLRLWVPGAAATAAALAVVAGLEFGSRPTMDVEQLVAQAYRHDRSLELRIPGASFAPRQQRRTDLQESLLSSSDASLGKAAEAVRSLCNRRPQSTPCLLYEARLNLIVWRYTPALLALQRINDTPKPPDFYMNRAIALFEKAESEKDSNGSSSLYGEAAEDLSKILASDPENQVALFNRALMYEKLQMMEASSADWQKLLERETDPGWREEARDHLSRIEQKKKTRP